MRLLRILGIICNMSLRRSRKSIRRLASWWIEQFGCQYNHRKNMQWNRMCSLPLPCEQCINSVIGKSMIRCIGMRGRHNEANKEEWSWASSVCWKIWTEMRVYPTWWQLRLCGGMLGGEGKQQLDTLMKMWREFSPADKLKEVLGCWRKAYLKGCYQIALSSRCKILSMSIPCINSERLIPS